MRTVLPLHLADVDEPEIRLVDEGCRLKRVAHPLVPHVTAGNAAKLRMDDGNELLERRLVPLPPRDEEVCDLSR